VFYDIKGEEKKNVYILLFCLINHKRQNEKTKRHMPMKNACSDDDNCTVPNRTFILFLKKIKSNFFFI
jgi:hypothetical protein